MKAITLQARHRRAAHFRYFCAAAAWSGLFFLAILLISVAIEGIPWLNWDFLTHYPSRFPEKAGIKSALWGTVWLMTITAAISVPLGVASAIFLEEFAPKTKLMAVIEINIANLAGVPSIVYGILGLAIFVRTMGLGRSLLAGSLTLSLLILPTIIIASREAIKGVPDSIRFASLALGATKWQTVRHHVVPEAFPGILTGVILALSRAIGETAPLVMMGALTFVTFVPQTIMDDFTALPIQIFNWASRPQEDFHSLSAAGILVLLAALLLMNSAVIAIREISERKKL